MILEYIRYLRHGPLKKISPIWLKLGTIVRYFISFFNFSIKQKIGNYGPFFLDNHFIFSNFSEWGSGHNNGFSNCIQECKNKMCFVDVGAHVGLVSLPAASVMPKNSKVISFEPALKNLEMLKKHINLNNFIDQIIIENFLLGEKNIHEVTFFQDKKPTGMNSIVKNEKTNYQLTKVTQISLDSYFENNQYSPDIMKIDVEGAEINVLMGAKKTIRKHKPVIYLSVHPINIIRFGQSIKMLSKIIQDLNYSCYEINGYPVKNFQLKEYKLLPN